MTPVTLSTISPEALKIIGYMVLIWFFGFGVGKTFSFISSIFKRATGSRH